MIYPFKTVVCIAFFLVLQVPNTLAQESTQAQLLYFDSLARINLSANAKEALIMAHRNYEQLADQPIDAYTKARILFTLGTAHNVNGNLPQALDYTLQALSIFQRLEAYKMVLRCYNTVGGIYYDLGEYHKTIENINLSMRLAQENGYTDNFSKLNNNLGGAYRQLKRYKEALNVTRIGLAQAKKSKQKEDEIFAMSTLAEIYLDKGLYDSSIYYIDKIMNLPATYLLTSYQKVFCFLALGENYYHLGYFDRAIQFGRQSYTIANSQGYKLLERDASELLYMAWKTKGNLDSIAFFQNSMITLQDSIWNAKKELRLNKILIQHKEAEVQLRTLEIQRQRFIATALAVSGGVFLIASIIFIRSSKKYNRLYRKVDQQNKIIGEKNKMLTQQKVSMEELHHLKDKIFSMVLHDFKTPIHSLENTLNLLIKRYITPDEATGLAKNMLQDLIKSKTSINNLIIWAKSQMNGLVITPSKININDLVEHALSVHSESAIQKYITILNEVEKDFDFNSDRDILTIVLNNLINNAIKFSQTNGQISVFASMNKDWIHIAVKDNGVGISDARQKTIFQVGHDSTAGTAHEKGTGLGLLICKELINKLEGDITVESEIGSGTTFSISIENYH